MGIKLFFSYSHKCRKDHVNNLASHLKTKYKQIQPIIDNGDVSGNLIDWMSSSIDEADICIIFVSNEYSDSKNCRKEAEYIDKRDKKCIYIHLEKDNWKNKGWLEMQMGTILWLNFKKEQGVSDFAENLVYQVSKILGRKVDQFLPKQTADTTKNDITSEFKKINLQDAVSKRNVDNRHNLGLVQHLKAAGVIRTPRVSEAMVAVDRTFFAKTKPYFDTPQYNGYGATISAPHMHAHALEILEKHLQPGMRVLDVGSGSGYLTCAMALMVGPKGRVVGIDHVKEFIAESIQNVKNAKLDSLLQSDNMKFVEGDGRQGYAKDAPYNAIHVGASSPDIPPALIEQLVPGGRLFLPVGEPDSTQSLQVVEKQKDGSVVIEHMFGVRYMPLGSKESQLSKA